MFPWTYSIAFGTTETNLLLLLLLLLLFKINLIFKKTVMVCGWTKKNKIKATENKLENMDKHNK